MHCDLDLGDMTLVQSHDTPLGHGQQLSYGPDTDFGYVCTVTLTLVQGLDTPLVHRQQINKIQANSENCSPPTQLSGSNCLGCNFYGLVAMIALSVN